MMINQVCQYLIDNNITISSVESLTGGLFASTITELSGISKVYQGSLVTYTNEIKQEVLGVHYETLEKYGAVSKECVSEMLERGFNIFQTNIVIAFSGNAGPSASEGKPVGLVYIGYMINGESHIHEYNFTGTREEIRKQCILTVFSNLYELFLGKTEK